MPNPRMGPLASRLVAAIFWTFPCERQVKECRASEGESPGRRGVIHVPGRNEVSARGHSGYRPTKYCRCCGPDSCCADRPPAEPSLRVACLKKPVALLGIRFPRTSGFPPWNRLRGCLWHAQRPVPGSSRAATFEVAAPPVAFQALFIPWSSSQFGLAVGHSPISPGLGRDASGFPGGWKVLS